MSMSSLGAQLAALSSAGTTSSGATSRRTEDGIGRGLHHSAHHGHSLYHHHNNNPKIKPSVLQPDARAASDIPLSSIRNDAVVSLKALHAITSNEEFISKKYMHSLLGNHSLSYERGLQTKEQNEKTDNMIQSLLILLSTAMGEPSKSKDEHSPMYHALHVIEYLLRRYDIHTRPSSSHYLLLYTLPHHDQPVFTRLLQLIDLTNTTQLVVFTTICISWL